MAAMKCLLVFLNIFLLIEAQAILLCGGDQYGVITSNEIELGNEVLVPGYSTFRVDIPEVCYGYRVGVKVSACDHDVAPQVLVVSQRLAFVKRKGALNTVGYVSGSVYCNEGPFLGSSSHTKKEPLTIHPVEESRDNIQGNRRAIRSPEGTNDALDQNRINSQSPISRQTEHSRKPANDARENTKSRREDENDANSGKQSRKATKSDDTIRADLGDHTRKVAIAQAPQGDSQKTQRSKHTSNERATKGLRKSEEERYRRDLQSSVEVNKSSKNNEVAEDNASRLGYRLRASRLNDVQFATDTFRKTLGTNSRLDTLTKASLQALEEARQADNVHNSFIANSQRNLDQSYRQALNNMRQDTSNLDQRGIGWNIRAATDSNQEPSRFDQSTYQQEESIRGQSIDKSRLEEIQKASRIAQEANDQQLANILRESLASKQERRNAFEQVSRQAQKILSNVQGPDAEQETRALKEALEQASRQSALNEAQIEALHAASRVGQFQSDSILQSSPISQVGPELNMQRHNVRQGTDAVHEVNSLNAHQANDNQARLSSLQDQENTGQRIEYRRTSAAVARQIATEQARRASLDQRYQNNQINDAREINSRQALTAIARQKAIQQARRTSLDQKNQNNQINDAQKINFRGASASVAHEIAIEQARRASLDQRRQNNQMYNTQGVDSRGASATIARQLAIEQDRHESLDQRRDYHQIKEARQDANTMRAALEENSRQTNLGQQLHQDSLRHSGQNNNILQTIKALHSRF